MVSLPAEKSSRARATIACSASAIREGIFSRSVSNSAATYSSRQISELPCEVVTFITNTSNAGGGDSAGTKLTVDFTLGNACGPYGKYCRCVHPVNLVSRGQAENLPAHSTDRAQSQYRPSRDSGPRRCKRFVLFWSGPRGGENRACLPHPPP